MPTGPYPSRGAEDVVRVDLLVDLEGFYRAALDDLRRGGRPDAFPTAVYGARLSADFGEDHLRAAMNWLRSLVGAARFEPHGRVTLPLPGDGRFAVTRHMANSAPRRWGASENGRQSRRGYAGAVACIAQTAIQSLPPIAPDDGYPARARALRTMIEHCCALAVLEGLGAMVVRYRLPASTAREGTRRTVRWFEQVAAAVARMDASVRVLVARPEIAARVGAARCGHELQHLADRLTALPVDASGDLTPVIAHLGRMAETVVHLPETGRAPAPAWPGPPGRGWPAASPVRISGGRLDVALSDVVLVRRASGSHRLAGVVRPAAGATGPRRLWVRALATRTGALLYEAECTTDDGVLGAELFGAGDHPQDFSVEFTHDLGRPPTGALRARTEVARQVGAEAAVRQEHAATGTDWDEVARLWDRSAQLWLRVGDPARGALSAVHAVRAYRCAGAEEATLLELAADARAVAQQWGRDRPSRAATPPPVTDPHVLRELVRAAGLTRHLELWSVRAIAFAVEVTRASVAPPGPSMRIPAGRDGGSGSRPGPTRAAARVALASWAASTGRRRLAHAILVPAAIEYSDLDVSGRHELEDTHALLAAPPSVSDPDEPSR